MKIAFVTQPFDLIGPSTQLSSIPIIAYQIARRLASSNEIILYGIQGQHQPREESDDLGIHYKRISVNIENWLVKSLKIYDLISPLHDPKKPSFSSYLHHLGYALQVGRDIKEQNCDIIHIFNFSQFGPVIRAVAPEVKIVLHMQCEWLTQLDKKMIERRLGDIDLVLGCSDYITNKIRDRFPQFADRCQTAYNGVDLDDFRNMDKSNSDINEKILFVGRVSPEKGVHVLLDAYQYVLKKRPQAQLNIVGPPGVVPFDYVVKVSDDEEVVKLGSFYSGRFRKRDHYGEYLNKQLSSDEWEKVNMVGGVPHQSVVDYYRSADVFVFTSVWDEPFGIPMVEAMACGLPIVAVNGGAVPEIVEDGKTGFRVDRGNPVELARAIFRLLENRELRESMGKAGRKRASELFSWDSTAKKLFDYYQNILAD